LGFGDRTGKLGGLRRVGVPATIIGIHRLAGDEDDRSDALLQGNERPGVLSGVPHAVDHDVGTIGQQLGEVVGGVSVRPDEANARLTQIASEVGLGIARCR
jgi:hypothetical protein